MAIPTDGICGHDDFLYYHFHLALVDTLNTEPWTRGFFRLEKASGVNHRNHRRIMIHGRPFLFCIVSLVLLGVSSSHDSLIDIAQNILIPFSFYPPSCLSTAVTRRLWHLKPLSKTNVHDHSSDDRSFPDRIRRPCIRLTLVRT